MFDQKVMII